MGCLNKKDELCKLSPVKHNLRKRGDLDEKEIN
jgi:hypothetical protein